MYICVCMITCGLQSLWNSENLLHGMIWVTAVSVFRNGLCYSNLYPHLTSVSHLAFLLLLSGSREAAFVYAISSAGVVYALTRACSQGELRTCNCDPHKRGRDKDDRGEFDWGGCSDNINYGIKFSKTFIDAKERTVRDARALMNLHNNRCGRTVSVWLLCIKTHWT